MYTRLGGKRKKQLQVIWLIASFKSDLENEMDIPFKYGPQLFVSFNTYPSEFVDKKT